MNPIKKFACLIVITLLLSYSSPGYAHKVRVFAWAEQDLITVESSFSGGRKMVNGTITVTDESSGETIISGPTDDNGVFAFKIPTDIAEKKPILNILANGGDGHQAHWIMKPEDYLGSQSTTGQTQAKKSSSTPPSVTSSAGRNNCECSENEENEAQIDKILEARLAPIKRDLASLSDPRPRLQEILGGVGYLIGLAGVAAWIQSRKKNN